MKRIIIMLIAVGVLCSCSDDHIVTYQDGSRELVEPYGILNLGEKNHNVRYELSVQDIILSVVFSETLIVPVISIGFYLYEPQELIDDSPDKKASK